MKIKKRTLKLIGFVFAIVLLTFIYTSTRPINYNEPPTEKAVKGNEDSQIHLEIFSDYECPFCSKAAEQEPQLVEKYGDKIKITFYHFPLPFHSHAQLAAEASECANDQGKFWEYHEILFKNQDALSQKYLLEYAEELDLNKNDFQNCLLSRAKKDNVELDKAKGNQYGVSGTPSYFLNGEKMARWDIGSISYYIDQAIANE